MLALLATIVDLGTSWAGCSKLTTPLVNVSLKFKT